MSIALSQITPLIKDYARNSNLTDARCIRAINTAVALIKNMFGIPGYERQYQFNFFDDQLTYTQPDDFYEPINLRFDDDTFNETRRFIYKPAELLYERAVAVDMDTLLWGHDYSTGQALAVVIAKNSTSGFFIDSMKSDNALNWTAADDASNIRDDLFFQYGDRGQTGTLEYDVVVAGNNRATVYSFIGPYDWSQVQDTGYLKVYHYIPNLTHYTSCSINYSSDATYPGTNYAKITVTTQADGSAFVVGLNILAFKIANQVVVGTPDFTTVKLLWLQDNYTAAYVSTADFRYMNLVLDIPDLMDESYYTKYKGTDASGNKIVSFSATTDILGFGSMGEDDMMELVALQAAILINPSILVDDKSVKNLFDTYTKIFMRRYPKKRLNNLLAEPRTAKTSHNIGN